MKAVIQKSGYAEVNIDGEAHSSIESGLVILLGVTTTDSEKDVDYLVEKIVNLRLFEEGEKFFDKSIMEVNKEILVVSQFNLYADCNNGRRPDFVRAAKRDQAEPLYELFVEKLRAKNLNVKTGVFGAMMKISLTNEGPVTIIIASPQSEAS